MFVWTLTRIYYWYFLNDFSTLCEGRYCGKHTIARNLWALTSANAVPEKSYRDDLSYDIGVTL